MATVRSLPAPSPATTKPSPLHPLSFSLFDPKPSWSGKAIVLLGLSWWSLGKKVPHLGQPSGSFSLVSSLSLSLFLSF